MRKIIVSEFVTLDGVTEAPGGEPGFEHTGWSIPYFNDEYLRYKLKEIQDAGALLLGRKTYEGFAGAWPSRTDEMGFADKMNQIPKYVISTTLQQAAWNNSTIISSHVTDAIARLKQEPGGNILVAGSNTLVQTLFRHGLADEYRLMIHPVILGSGIRLFNSALKQRLQLLNTTVFSTGTIVLEYGLKN